MAQIENPYCYIVTKLQCDKKSICLLLNVDIWLPISQAVLI